MGAATDDRVAPLGQSSNCGPRVWASAIRNGQADLRATAGVPKRLHSLIKGRWYEYDSVATARTDWSRFEISTQLLDVNAQLGTATVRVDLSEVTEATVPVVRAAGLAVNALMGQVLAERLLGLDIGPTNSYLDVAIPDRNPVMVHVSLATEPRRLLKALRSNGVSTIEVDVVVFDGNLAEWARGRMAWTIRQRRSAEWPVNSP